MLGNSLPPVFSPAQQSYVTAVQQTAVSDQFSAPPPMNGGQPAPASRSDEVGLAALPVLQTVPPLAPIMAVDKPAETQAPPPSVTEVVATAPTVPVAVPGRPATYAPSEPREPRSVVWRETVQPRALGAAVTRGELDPVDEVQPAEWSRRISEKVAEAKRIRDWAKDLDQAAAPQAPLVGRPAPEYPAATTYPGAIEAYREMTRVVSAL